MINRKIFCKSGPWFRVAVVGWTVVWLQAHYPQLQEIAYGTIACVVIYVIAFAVGLGKCFPYSRTQPRRLYILCWREHSRRKLSPTLAKPSTLALTTLVAQCELSRR